MSESCLRTSVAGRRLRVLLAVCVMLAGLSALGADAHATANPGAIDPSFGQGGHSLVATGVWATASAAVVTRDGGIVTVGEAHLDSGYAMISTRMLSDGRLDPGYGIGGLVTIPLGGYGCGNAIAVQPDGKIVLAGTGNGNSALDFAAVRLEPDGSLDPTFGNGGIVTVSINGAAIANGVSLQRDGKIILAGTTHSNANHEAFVRLLSNGSLDGSFGNHGVEELPPTAGAWGVVVQPDGRVVSIGQQDVGGTQAYIVARLLPNGTPDPMFGHGGLVTVRIGRYAFGDAIALRPDGRIVVTGAATTDVGVIATVQLLPNGGLDPRFGNGGVATTPGGGVNAVALDPQGRILVAGVGAGIVRLTSTGGLDTTFGTHGATLISVGTSDAANGVALDPTSGKIVLAGCATVGGHLELSVLRLGGDQPSSRTGTRVGARQLSAQMSRTDRHRRRVRRPRGVDSRLRRTGTLSRRSV